jgi:hypothetical protein
MLNLGDTLIINDLPYVLSNVQFHDELTFYIKKAGKCKECYETCVYRNKFNYKRERFFGSPNAPFCGMCFKDITEAQDWINTLPPYFKVTKRIQEKDLKEYENLYKDKLAYWTKELENIMNQIEDFKAGKIGLKGITPFKNLKELSVIYRKIILDFNEINGIINEKTEEI